MKYKTWLIYGVALASALTFEIYDTFSSSHYKSLFKDSGIEFTSRDNSYIRVDKYWFRNKCAPYVAKYFVENNITWQEESMDCEDLADLFIALVKAKYHQDFKDSNGVFTKPKKALVIGHIVTEHIKTKIRHDAVIIDFNGEFKIIEPIDFCKAVLDNPIAISFHLHSFAEILSDSVIQEVHF